MVLLLKITARNTQCSWQRTKSALWNPRKVLIHSWEAAWFRPRREPDFGPCHCATFPKPLNLSFCGFLSCEMWTLVAQARKDFMKGPCKEVMGERGCTRCSGLCSRHRGRSTPWGFQTLFRHTLDKNPSAQANWCFAAVQNWCPRQPFHFKEKKKKERNSF